MAKPIPLFNLRLHLDGWQGPFDNIDELKPVAKNLEEFRTYHLDIFRVLSNMRLESPSNDELYTYDAHADLRTSSLKVAFRGETIPLTHIHFIHLPFFNKTRDLILLTDPEEAFKSIFSDNKLHSLYTLEGLYNTLPKEKQKDLPSRIYILSKTLVDLDAGIPGINTANHPQPNLLRYLEEEYEAFMHEKYGVSK